MRLTWAGLACFACGLAAAGQLGYLYRFLAEPANAYRVEYLEGLTLIAALSSCAWLTLLVDTGMRYALLTPRARRLRLAFALPIPGLTLLAAALGAIL